MTEDDLFNALKKPTYNQLMEEWAAYLPGNRNSAAAVKQYVESRGWNYEVWRIEFNRRKELRVL